MEIKLKSAQIENFKGIKELSVNFADKTDIKGANATGKTSIFDAITWLLFNKNSLNVEKFDVRPLDADGNPIHYVEISVTATFEVDGKETTLRKVQKENWVKSRGEEKAEFKGNVNAFEVNGFPKSERDYKTFIADMVSEDLFKMLSNPLYFPNMKWKDQRDILMQLASKESDVEIARRIGGYEELLPDLENATSTDDIRVKYTKALKELKQKQSEIPVRIDEISKQKVDSDVSALELQKKALDEKLKALEAKDNRQAISDLKDKLLTLEFSINDAVRKANEGNVKALNDANNALYDAKSRLSSVQHEIDHLTREVDEDKQTLSAKEHAITVAGNEYKEVQATTFPEEKWQFDENSTICSMCGQKLPADKINFLKNDFANRKAQAVTSFEENKKAKSRELIDKGNELKSAIQQLKETIANETAEIEKRFEVEEMIKKEISILEEKKSQIPEHADMSSNEEYKALINRKAEIQKQIDDLNTASDNTAEVMNVKNELLNVEAEISKAMNNANIDERIEELKEELKIVGQKVADAEKMLYLFENFIRAKLDAISASINGHFKMANWKLFDTQINGSIAECCEATYDGIPFSNLNRGHQILVGMDICETLAEIYGSNVFMFVDNAEAVNDFNMPETENQLILLKVSEDKELKVVTG